MITEGDTAFVFYTGDAQVGLRTIPVEQLTNWDSEGKEAADLL